MTRGLLIAIACVACRGAAGAREVQPDDEVVLSPQQMAKAAIRVAEAEARPLAQAITVAGRVAFDGLHATHVFSPVTGRVTRVLVKPGDHVAKGAPLVAILSPDVGTAFSDTVKAQADLQASQLEYEREQRLLREDATSQRSLEAAQDAYRRATAEYERAKQRALMLRSGGLNMVTQEYVLRSFIDGDVIARNVGVGVEVAGQYSGGTALELFTIGDIKRVWVDADVPDIDVPDVHVGDAIEIRVLAYPSRVFRGTIDLVASTVDPVLRTARVRCSLANEGEELKPEMFASVSILRAPQRQIAVPHDAVVAINEATYVYVAAGMRPDGRLVFKRRRVTTGDERGGLIPILDGLAAGERVVIEGSVSPEQPNDEVWPTPKQIEEGHITTARVERRDLPDAIGIGARLAFDDTRITHVFSPVNGRVTRVLARGGQHVTKGTPLLAITSPDLGGYLADVAKAEADKVLATHEFERQQELYAAGVGAKRELEIADDTLRKASAELARARQLSQLLAPSDFDSVTQEYVLRSPIAGEVIGLHATPGLEVQGQYANGGSSSNVVELFTIGDLGRLWVLGDVYEVDLPRVTEGDEVSIRISAYPGKEIRTRVDWVSDVLDPVQHTARVRCVIDNPDRLLKPEMYERVDLEVPGKQMVVVPRSALMRVDGETIAFVETGEKRPDGGVVFKRRKVIARLDANTPMVAVSSGLDVGEIVAVDHSLMLLGML